MDLEGLAQLVTIPLARSERLYAYRFWARVLQWEFHK